MEKRFTKNALINLVNSKIFRTFAKNHWCFLRKIGRKNTRTVWAIFDKNGGCNKAKSGIVNNFFSLDVSISYGLFLGIFGS